MYALISLAKVDAEPASGYADEPEVDADDGLGGTLAERKRRRVKRRVHYLMRKLMYPREHDIRVNGDRTQIVFEFARQLSAENVDRIESLMPDGVEFRVFETSDEVLAVMAADPTWATAGAL
jgi:hypothetical protein